MTAEGAVCRPNISPAGRRMRRAFGFTMIAAAIGGALLMAWYRVGWPWRALTFFPATLAGFGLFQASRNTCVARAAEGMFEHDDMSRTPAPADEVAASRAVARGIRRASVLLGLAGAALAVATAFVG